MGEPLFRQILTSIAKLSIAVLKDFLTIFMLFYDELFTEMKVNSGIYIYIWLVIGD